VNQVMFDRSDYQSFRDFVDKLEHCV